MRALSGVGCVAKFFPERLSKRIASDYVLTFLSTLVMVGVVQLAVYPSIARCTGAGSYGVFLTAMGVVNSVMPAFGSTLRNAHIVLDSDYEERGFSRSDFKVLLLATSPTVAFAVALGLNSLILHDAVSMLFVCALLVVGIARAYCLVVFRLPVNPKRNLISSLFSCAGYLVGLPFAVGFGLMFMPFLLAESFGLVYCLVKTEVLRCRASRTPLFPCAAKTHSFLVLTSLVTYCSVYIDRIMLFPLLGAASVSTYYASSFVGKACSFFMSPASTLLLSYISERGSAITLSRYDKLNALFFAIVAMLGGILLLLAPFFTRLLYPSLVDAAMPYIYIANAASLLGVANGANVTILLKVAPTWWQLVISIMKLGLYVLVVSILAVAGTLHAFCWGLLVSNAAVITLTYLIGRHYVKKAQTPALKVNETNSVS